MEKVPDSQKDQCGPTVSPETVELLPVNNVEYSDRILRIEIESDEQEQFSKRRRISDKQGTSINGSDPLSSDSSAVVRVKTMHISSQILVANSPFFYTLLSNGMRESKQGDITLRIHESEEAALMDLLNFMYCNTLQVTSLSALLELLMAADKYDVPSCMTECCSILSNIRMNPESALLYLNLPSKSNVLMADVVQPFILCAKQSLASRYKDFTKFIDEVLNLPLTGIKVVFSRNDLQIRSEDDVYDFLLKWARHHYPKLKKRKQIIGTHLVLLIRFSFMSRRRLKEALECVDLDGKSARKAILEALVEALHKCDVPRAYIYKPVKVIEFEQPCQQCVVYLDLQRDECKTLYPGGKVYSQGFSVGAHTFFLSAKCEMGRHSNVLRTFGLHLVMQGKRSASFLVDFEFATRSKPINGYVSRCKGSDEFRGGTSAGFRNMFRMSWEDFMAEDSQHFINGVLHIRAELTIRK